MRDRPYVTINQIISLNGHLRLASGRSVGMGSKADRALMDLLRAEVDGVVTGGSTIRLDDPWLHVRQAFAWRYRQSLGFSKHPRGIVLSQKAQAFAQARCFRAPDGICPDTWQAPWVIEAPGDDWSAWLGALKRRGMQRILIEAGPRLSNAFVGAGLVDEIFVTIAPLFICDSNGPTGPVIQPVGKMEGPVRLVQKGVETLDDYIFTHWATATAQARDEKPDPSASNTSRLQTLLDRYRTAS